MPWSRSDKIDFFRKYLGAVFPLLEGTYPPESLVDGCRVFLQLCGDATLEVSRGGVKVGNVRPVSPAVARVQEFLVKALEEKLSH